MRQSIFTKVSNFLRTFKKPDGPLLPVGFRFVEELGQGGMGRVIKALHPRLGIPVAIKIIRPEYARDGAYRKRFIDEARVVASLKHANIVQIYDRLDSDGHLYIVMEYVQGKDLARHIADEGRLTVEGAVEYMLQAGSALSEIHAHKIVHRDVKPENILITPDGRIRITDFGLAYLPRNASGSSGRTFLGTPGYMSPEQARGQRVDVRSDIYSLGVVIFFMVTGCTPFDEQDPLALAISGRMPPSICEIDPKLPSWLADGVQKAMDPEPAKRFQNMTEFSQWLSAWNASNSYETLEDFLGFTSPFETIREEAIGFGLFSDDIDAELSQDVKTLLTPYLPTVVGAVSRAWREPYAHAGKDVRQEILPRDAYVQSIYTHIIPDVLTQEGIAELSKLCVPGGPKYAHLSLALAYAFWAEYRDAHLLTQVGVTESVPALLERSLERRKVRLSSLKQNDERTGALNLSLGLSLELEPEFVRTYEYAFDEVRATAKQHEAFIWDKARGTTDNVELCSLLQIYLPRMPIILGDTFNKLLNAVRGEQPNPLALVLICLGLCFVAETQYMYQK